MFICKNLRVRVEEKTLLSNISFDVKPGEIHVIMGPNGGGKSSLLKSIAGIGGYSVLADTLSLNDADLTPFDIAKRANLGIFLSFQHPPAIPGLKLVSLIKESINARQTDQKKEKLSSAIILNELKKWTKELQFDEYLYKSEVNYNLSGGQQKMSELLQLAMLQPELAMLDEIDSGLDVDSLKKVANGINLLADGKRSFIIVTHSRKMTDYLNKIDHVHVLINGQIKTSGGKDLIDFVDKNGYESFIGETL